MQELRTLTPNGIERFRAYLNHLKDNHNTSPPMDILKDTSFSKKLQANIYIAPDKLTSPLEAMKYLSDVLLPVKEKGFYYDMGLWSWLSLYYFDIVCPAKEDGTRKPGRDYRHIPDKNYRYRHRHLLSGRLQVYDMYKEGAILLLGLQLYSESKIHQELAGRQNFITNKNIVELAEILYLDSAKGIAKKKAQSKKVPGNIFRFISVIQQLDVTYDLYSMTYEEILVLLPPEFDRWREQSTM